MANQSSAMWLLVMAGVLVAALPVGMNMLVGMDETISGLQAVREQMNQFYGDALVTQRLEPPLTVTLETGERRKRVVVVALQMDAAVLGDAKKADERMNAALRQLRRAVGYNDGLAEKADFIQVDLWPKGDPAQRAAKPAFSKRREFVRAVGTFDVNPASRGTRKPVGSQSVSKLLLRADGSLFLDGQRVRLEDLKGRLVRLAAQNATVRLSHETGSDGKLSQQAEASMKVVLACVRDVGISLKVARD